VIGALGYLQKSARHEVAGQGVRLRRIEAKEIRNRLIAPMRSFHPTQQIADAFDRLSADAGILVESQARVSYFRAPCSSSPSMLPRLTFRVSIDKRADHALIGDAPLLGCALEELYTAA
jgi:hypothetical protein